MLAPKKFSFFFGFMCSSSSLAGSERFTRAEPTLFCELSSRAKPHYLIPAKNEWVLNGGGLRAVSGFGDVLAQNRHWHWSLRKLPCRPFSRSATTRFRRRVRLRGSREQRELIPSSVGRDSLQGCLGVPFQEMRSVFRFGPGMFLRGIF